MRLSGERYIGTEDVVGATVKYVDSAEVVLDKDGKTLVLRLHEEWPMTCFCEGNCGCTPTVYLRALAKVDDQGT